MRARLRSVLAALALAVLGWENAGEAGEVMSDRDVILYFVPFDHETYVPVTKQSIEKNATCVLSIPSNGVEAAMIRRLIEAAGEGSFDGQFVRLKAVGLVADDLFVDKFGEVETKDLEKKLDANGRGQLSELLGGLARAQGCQY